MDDLGIDVDSLTLIDPVNQFGDPGNINFPEYVKSVDNYYQDSMSPFAGGLHQTLLLIHHRHIRIMTCQATRQSGKSFYDKLTGEAREQMLQDLSDFTQAFDSAFGTNLYGGMVREGFTH